MLLGVAAFIKVKALASVSFEMPAMDITKGLLAVPPKSPAN